MGGKFSRNKGRRGEQNLVLALAKLGYKAERILRQYQEAGQADVKAEKNGEVTTFELKCRRLSFKSIYELYFSERDGNGVLKFVLNSMGTAVAVSTDLEMLTAVPGAFRNLTLFPPLKKHIKVYNRLVRLKEVKQTADYLVIKDNNKPMLYIRYWG